MARKATGTAPAANTARSTATTARSRTGCMTCRTRKLKCDEAKPVCANCQKGNRECVPADTITFRHQQNPSLDGVKGIGNFYQYKDTYRSGQYWVPIPQDLRYVYIINPYAPDPEPETMGARGTGYQQMATHSLEALSTAATRDSNAQFPAPYPSTTYPDNNSMFAQYPPYATRADMSNTLSSSVIDPNLETVPTAQQNNNEAPAGSPQVTLPFQFKMDGIPQQDGQSDDQVATLLRKFSEGPAPWMDLFNSNNYFTLQVPMRFINSPVVRYAALALAAKYASVQSKNSLAAPSSIASTISSTNLAADGLQYEQLVSLFHDRALELTRVSMGDALTPASSSMNQDILTAVALICFLKLMSNPSLETGSFLGTLITEMLPAKAVLDGSSDGFRSIFFEIVRYDCLSAFINGRHAILEPENISLWRAVGLQIDHDTRLLNNISTTSSGPRAIVQYSCNSLFWILIKVVNFIADGDRVIFDPNQVHSPSLIGVSQRTLLEKWDQLNNELKLWQKGLSDSFTPAARIKPAESRPRLRAFTEIRYHVPQCASAMQFYYMASILLLINKPHETTAGRSTITSRLNSYVSITDEIRVQAREICGISASKPKAAIRALSIQPLFVAGQCLGNELERNNVLDMLEDVQNDTGWVTGYRIEQLKNEWGWARA